MAQDDLSLLTLAEAARLIRQRELSPVALVGAVLRRIEQLDARLNCYITVLHEQALAEAQASEALLQAGTYLGPLHGIPISLKDSIATAGVLTTAGSPVLADWVPQISATVAHRLKAAGAVLIGKANLYEFAYGQPHPKYGRTLNPWSARHNCGGTSSGSAAGVVAGLACASIGTDAAGSVRIPAAFCGVVGLKPTFGLVSRAGTVPGSSNLDCVGPLTRSVTDAAIVLQAIAGFDPADASTLRRPVPAMLADLERGVHGLRLGVLADLEAEPLDPEVRAAFETACGLLRDQGATLQSVRLVDPILTRTVLWAIFASETAEYHRPHLHSQATGAYSSLVRTNLQAGEFVPATAYVRAQKVRQVLINQVREALAGVDALLLPTVPFPAYALAPDAEDTLTQGETKIESLLELKTRYTALFNLTGQPAVAVPCGFSAGGLPISLQIVGKPLQDALVLRIARAYEMSTPWHRRSPSLA